MPFYGAVAEFIRVCNTNALLCCDGDNCTNYFLNDTAVKTEKTCEQEGVTNNDIKD